MKAGHNSPCAYCGRLMSRKLKNRNKDFYATKDHFIPRALGGHSGKVNIIRCCLACNHDKANLTPNEWRLVLMLRRRRPVVFHFEWCLLKSITHFAIVRLAMVQL